MTDMSRDLGPCIVLSVNSSQFHRGTARFYRKVDALPDLVMSKIKQIFPDRDVAEILTLLDTYGTESYEREQSRVQLAILKLSDGDFDQLIQLIEIAKPDYRDVLGPAEYPRSQEALFDGQEEIIGEDGLKRLEREDRIQYLLWLYGNDISTWPPEGL